MSKTSSCDHEITQPVEKRGDLVSECCHCEQTLGPAEPWEKTLPGHWHHNITTFNPYACVAADVLKGDLPRDPSETDRYVNICGNCGHWLGAVHSDYFESLSAPYDEAESTHSFIGSLMESLCPECGAGVFRHGQVLMAYQDAVAAKKEPYNVTTYVKERANFDFWSGSVYGLFFIESRFLDFDDGYVARCPSCGWAEGWGGRDFDFHHWDYDEDIGCMLCRECHSHIHRDMRASEQAELSDGWRRDAISRLYERSTSRGLSFDGAHGFINRFNIPNKSAMVEYVERKIA